MLRFEALRPAPPAPVPSGSLAFWILLAIVVAVVVTAGVGWLSRH